MNAIDNDAHQATPSHFSEKHGRPSDEAHEEGPGRPNVSPGDTSDTTMRRIEDGRSVHNLDATKVLDPRQGARSDRAHVRSDDLGTSPRVPNDAARASFTRGQNSAPQVSQKDLLRLQSAQHRAARRTFIRRRVSELVASKVSLLY